MYGAVKVPHARSLRHDVKASNFASGMMTKVRRLTNLIDPRTPRMEARKPRSEVPNEAVGWPRAAL